MTYKPTPNKIEYFFKTSVKGLRTACQTSSFIKEKKKEVAKSLDSGENNIYNLSELFVVHCAKLRKDPWKRKELRDKSGNFFSGLESER